MFCLYYTCRYILYTKITLSESVICLEKVFVNLNKDKDCTPAANDSYSLLSSVAKLKDTSQTQ